MWDHPNSHQELNKQNAWSLTLGWRNPSLQLCLETNRHSGIFPILWFKKSLEYVQPGNKKCIAPVFRKPSSGGRSHGKSWKESSRKALISKKTRKNDARPSQMSQHANILKTWSQILTRPLKDPSICYYIWDRVDVLQNPPASSTSILLLFSN